MPYPDEVTLLTADRARIERLPVPVLIDEWQRHAPVWDLVRRSVDRDRSPGRFVLTGSASPKVSPTHSGAGRIVRLRVRPMSLAERALISPAVSLAERLSGERPDVRGDSPLGLEDYVDEILRLSSAAVQVERHGWGVTVKGLGRLRPAGHRFRAARGSCSFALAQVCPWWSCGFLRWVSDFVTMRNLP